MLEIFLQAIRRRRKVRLTFYSKEDRGILTRTCAPLDYGPSRRPGVRRNDRFHFWDYDSDDPRGPHVLSLNPEQVVSIEFLHETFEPADIVTWSTLTSPWFVSRNWGAYS